MNDFSEFLYTRRKALGLTQQNVADALHVTNKAVSKWEAGECFPETAQLTALADLLGCTVDELLRGRFAERAYTPQEETEARAETARVADEEPRRPLKTWQGVCIGAGAALVLLGVAALMLVIALGKGAQEENGRLGTAVLFAFLAVAVFLFVFAGASYGVTDVAKEEQKPKARVCTAALAAGVFVIIASIIAVMVLPDIVGTAVMLSVMAAGVAAVVLAGIGMAGIPTSGGSERKKESPWSAVIMLTATVVFLLFGFLFGKWHPAWVAFPVGGILCGIVEAVERFFRRDK